MPHRPALPRGRINDDFPFLLGHEVAGVVESVGDGVDTVAPGDFVIHGNVTRGDSVAVIGCGGVGDAAIAGAVMAGATTIIGVDVDPSKLRCPPQT